MRQFSSAIFMAAILIVSLSSCGKKSDAPGADSTKAAASTSAGNQATLSPAARYPIKSGIIHGESETMGMKGTTTKYFDEYGAKICEENSSVITMGSSTIKSNHVRIIKDGWMYSYEPEKKTGMKMKFSIPANMDFRNMGEQTKKEMGITEAGTETILGKECKIYQYSGSDKAAMTGKSWIFWNAEPMKMDMKVGNLTMKSHVTSIEENATIPAGKFDVPADITMKEMDATRPPPAGK